MLIMPGWARSAQVSSGQLRPAQVRSTQVEFGQVRSGQVRLCHVGLGGVMIWPFPTLALGFMCFNFVLGFISAGQRLITEGNTRRTCLEGSRQAKALRHKWPCERSMRNAPSRTRGLPRPPTRSIPAGQLAQRVERGPIRHKSARHLSCVAGHRVPSCTSLAGQHRR